MAYKFTSVANFRLKVYVVNKFKPERVKTYAMYKVRTKDRAIMVIVHRSWSCYTETFNRLNVWTSLNFTERYDRLVDESPSHFSPILPAPLSLS